MIKVKISTAYGKQLYERGCKHEGTALNQIYRNWSYQKQKAFDRCYNEYLNSVDRTTFSIISHNTFSFSVSWLCKLDGHYGMRIETSRNSYFVDFEE